MKNAYDIIKEEAIKAQYNKELLEEDFEHIIWGHTSYPSFWRIGIDGNTPEECFRKQVKDFFEGRVDLTICCDPNGVEQIIRGAIGEKQDSKSGKQDKG